jgi:hypothetical protein
VREKEKTEKRQRKDREKEKGREGEKAMRRKMYVNIWQGNRLLLEQRKGDRREVRGKKKDGQRKRKKKKVR